MSVAEHARVLTIHNMATTIPQLLQAAKAHYHPSTYHPRILPLTIKSKDWHLA